MISDKGLDARYGGKPLDPTQAANYLPYGPKKIREMCSDGEIECVKHVDGVDRWGNPRTRYWIYPRAIEAWIRRHSTAA